MAFELNDIRGKRVKFFFDSISWLKEMENLKNDNKTIAAGYVNNGVYYITILKDWA